MELMKYRLPTVQTNIIDANRKITKNGLKLYNHGKEKLMDYLKNNSESIITDSSHVCTACYHVYDYIEKKYFHEPAEEIENKTTLSVVITN